MDDVLGEFVIAAGDPHLRAEEPVGPVVLRFGAGGDVGQQEPACGSDRHIVPVKRPARVGLTNRSDLLGVP